MLWELCTYGIHGCNPLSLCLGLLCSWFRPLCLCVVAALEAIPSAEGCNLGKDVYSTWATSGRIWELEVINNFPHRLGASDSVHAYLGSASVSTKEDKLYHLCLSSYSRDLLTSLVVPGSKLNSGRKMGKATITYCISAENGWTELYYGRHSVGVYSSLVKGIIEILTAIINRIAWVQV